jgi:zinc/manganese transport system substrate-binding protein
MKKHAFSFKIIILSLLLLSFSPEVLASTLKTSTPKIKIIAAENFYGELAKILGGNYINVTSIISNPNADPHLFAFSPKLSQELMNADIIIYNGANYDPWMEQALNSRNFKTKVSIINVATLMKVKEGENPHIWYNPSTMPLLARVLAVQITSKLEDKVAISQVKHNLATFLEKYKVVENKVKVMKTKFAGVSVTATEPVFGLMAKALNFDMQGLDLQWKIMNDTEPSPKMLAQFEQLIINHKVHLLFYNNQVTDGTTLQILEFAHKYHLPSVGVSETMPPSLSIINWFMQELNQTESVLATSKQ